MSTCQVNGLRLRQVGTPDQEQTLKTSSELWLSSSAHRCPVMQMAMLSVLSCKA